MTHKQTTRRPRLMAMSFVAVGMALALMLTWGHNVAGEADAAITDPKPQMDLVVNGGECDSSVDTKCTLVIGNAFTLSIVPSILPEGGYFAFQSELKFGTLVYKPRDPEDEITFAGGILPLSAPELTSVAHVDFLCLGAPCLVKSQQKTALVNLEFNCTQQTPAGAFSQTVSLVPFNSANGSGSVFAQPPLIDPIFPEPNVGSLEINCIEAPVGGVAFEPKLTQLGQQTAGGSGGDASLWAGIAVAGVIASIAFAGSAAWFARRRAAE